MKGRSQPAEIQKRRLRASFFVSRPGCGGTFCFEKGEQKSAAFFAALLILHMLGSRDAQDGKGVLNDLGDAPDKIDPGVPQLGCGSFLYAAEGVEVVEGRSQAFGIAVEAGGVPASADRRISSGREPACG